MIMTINEDTINEFGFLMTDFKAQMLQPSGIEKRMKTYLNNYVKSHPKIEDLAAFALAMEFTGHNCSDDEMRQMWFDIHNELESDILAKSEEDYTNLKNITESLAETIFKKN